MELRSCYPLRGLLLLRGIASFPDFEGIQRFGFVLLDEIPQRELLLGLVGRFWTVGGGIQRVTREEFLAFDRPGYARVAWSFSVSPVGSGCRIDTETRILATSDDARRSFRRYWRLIRPFSGWTRTLMLREFERQLH